MLLFLGLLIHCVGRSGGARVQVPGWRLREPGALGRSHEKARNPEVPERLPHCAISAPAFSSCNRAFFGLHILNCNRFSLNGRCRARTWDRLIKSQRTENHKSLSNKPLTKSENPVFDTSLASLLQKFPELRELAEVWPKLAEHVKAAIEALVHSTGR